MPGLAVFLTGNQDYVPTSLLHNLKHNKVLHEKVMFVTVQTTDRPEEASEGRATVELLAPGIHRVMLRYGFMESPNIPRALEDLGPEAEFDPMQASYFLGREVLVPGMEPNLSWWRRWLFLWLARNAVPATEFFPHSQRPGGRTGCSRGNLTIRRHIGWTSGLVAPPNQR